MYGITKEKREYFLNKIKKEKEYLNTNYFQIGQYNVKMSDLVKNAYHNSDRYIAEVNQRVYSLFHYANNKGLKNIFGTITLPSEYHKLVDNKYKNKKYANKHIDTIYDIKTKQPSFENVKFEDYSPNAGAKKLSKMFKSLLDLRIYRDIDKEDKCYFRVYEPHKDGTPHLHFSLFIPENQINKVVSKFQDYFNRKYPNLQVKFETNIDNPIAYLMKYILKTFDDLRGKTDIDSISDLSLWYKANRITRFYTSRTLISLEIYRKLNGRYNLLELTHMYRNRELCVLLDIDTNKVVSIYDSIGRIYNRKQIQLNKITKSIKLKYKKKIKEPKLIIDGQEYIIRDGNIKECNPIVPVNKQSLQSLYTDYTQMNNCDVEDINLHHYGLVKNELIKRDFIEGEILSLNEYNTNFDYGV